MEKRVRIKIENVVVELPERVALRNPFYRILLQQDSKKTLQTKVQTPSSDTELKETKGSAELSEPVLPHKTQRRGRRKKEVGD